MPAKKKKGFLDSFRDLDGGVKDALADITTPLDLALSAMLIAHDFADKDDVSVEEIRAGLEAAGVALGKSSIAGALGRAGDRISRKWVDVDGDWRFRLMTKGRRQVEPLLGKGSVGVLYVAGDKPRTARRELGEILGGLSGTIRICDPYYGIATLDSLEMVPKACDVRFLSAQINEDQGRFARALKTFKKEHPNTQLRVYPRPAELHDRYILSSSKLLLVGHGLKDLGGKETFIITIDRPLAPDLHKQVEAAFDARWAIASIT